MSDILDQARELAARRQRILDAGVGWAHMDEYNVCTMKLAEMAPQLIAEVEHLRQITAVTSALYRSAEADLSAADLSGSTAQIGGE